MVATKSVTSLRQIRLCRFNGIKSVKKHRESRRTQIMKVCRLLDYKSHFETVQGLKEAQVT